MSPNLGYDPIATVQQAIGSLLSTQEPAFLGIGNRMFASFATILLVWYGVRMMLAWRESGEHMFSFAKQLLVIAFGDAMIAYYQSPIPGIGTSFSNLITDQAAYLAHILSARSVQDAQQSLNTLWNALQQPDAWSLLANLLYWTMLIVIGLAQFCAAVRRLVQHGRQRGLRARGTVVRSVLHRPDPRVAVLELAEDLHPVLVHARHRQRLHFRLREVPEPVPADAAARASA
jgi:hypothetical protein